MKHTSTANFGSFPAFPSSPPALVIDAVDDASQTIAAGASGTVSVLTNDTLDGAAVTTGTVTISANPLVQDRSNATVTGFTLGSDGLISVGSAVTAGTYTVIYEICENTLPSTNCDSAVATVVVAMAAVDYSDASTDGAAAPDGTLYNKRTPVRRITHKSIQV